MQKLSVVVITYNEEKNINRCLDSVTDVADEVIVVDSFSTDNTEKICNSFGVNFVRNKFEGHIEQKNFAASLANFPLILSLDADEALSKELISQILEVKINPVFDGYYMNRLTNYCGKWIRHCGWYPDRKLRLWKTGKGKWSGINPHDKFILDNQNNSGFLKGDILHYSYYSLKDHIDQINYFTELSSKAEYELGKRSNLFKILFNPVIKFNKDFFIKAGFLDGYEGFVISLISSFATFLKYAKIRNIQKENFGKQN